MQFEAEHRFDGSPAAVAAVLGDAAFYVGLSLPDLSLPEVVEQGQGPDGSGSRVLLRYEYTGHLDPTALRLLGGDRLTWTQEIRIRPDGSGTLTFLAEKNPGVLHGEATFTLVADGGGAIRHLSGDLVVSIPIIGGMAERRIVPGVLARLDIEAEAVNQRLHEA
jgi:hypothetical protein